MKQSLLVSPSSTPVYRDSLYLQYVNNQNFNFETTVLSIQYLFLLIIYLSILL